MSLTVAERERRARHRGRGERWCPGCITFLPFEAFTKNRAEADGLNYRCRRCVAEADIRRYVNRSPGQVEARRECHRRWRESRTPEQCLAKAEVCRVRETGDPKHNAQKAIRYLLKAGALPVARDCTCVNCGDGAAHYHHHLGYEPEHRLDTVLLCNRCHQREHNGHEW